MTACSLKTPGSSSPPDRTRSQAWIGPWPGSDHLGSGLGSQRQVGRGGHASALGAPRTPRGQLHQGLCWCFQPSPGPPVLTAQPLPLLAGRPHHQHMDRPVWRHSGPGDVDIGKGTWSCSSLGRLLPVAQAPALPGRRRPGLAPAASIHLPAGSASQKLAGSFCSVICVSPPRCDAHATRVRLNSTHWVPAPKAAPALHVCAE